MVTIGNPRRRLEALECGPGAQETKIFFIDEVQTRLILPV
jgi:hypothetical protein